MSSAVPIDATVGIKMLYVFVDIQMDNVHFLDTVKFNFEAGQSLALVSTIQFVAALQVTSISFYSTPFRTQVVVEMFPPFSVSDPHQSRFLYFLLCAPPPDAFGAFFCLFCLVGSVSVPAFLLLLYFFWVCNQSSSIS